MPTLWEGYIKCCRQCLPRSLEILLQLPPKPLSDALQHSRDLAEPLHKYIVTHQAQGAQVPPQITRIVLRALEGKAGMQGQGKEGGEEGGDEVMEGTR